ncbi:hypothetical protein F4810DRAFT_695784 [Camillea tinctor]|nr:hypothetical protein F4810DRAFT_695784 [Camillea tinctor]
MSAPGSQAPGVMQSQQHIGPHGSSFIKETLAFIQKTKRIPKSTGYNWLPFFLALREGCEHIFTQNENDRKDIFDSETDSDAGQNSDNDGGKKKNEKKKKKPRGRRPGQDRFETPFDKDKAPPKQSVKDGGSWDYVWYIPEWSHPNFNPSFSRTYTGQEVYLPSGDATFGTWPALRFEDQIKNPTEFALRFGVHPDELNGRSRTSPSTSKTRNPFDDLANQINMLTDEEKNQAIEASQYLWQAQNADPGDQLVHPDVMESILQKSGALGNEVLATQLEEALSIQNISVEQFIDQVNNGGSLVSQTHKTFFDTILRDQDWQRVLFDRFTTDELIQERIYLQSNDFTCDLEGPIHPLLDRYRWDDSSWKGAEPWGPRFLYNLNGNRHEWDVTTNDALWTAMQPALQLASRIIENKHPLMEAIANMETRQYVDPDRDPREEPRNTPHLVKYVLEKDIDPEKMPKPIARLKQTGFDWKQNTWDVLQKCLRFDIGSAFLMPGPEYGHPDLVNEHSDFIYASTTQNDPEQITITLSAEIIWPLLVNKYTKSEKITCSLILASTMVHELCHAIAIAQLAMTRDPDIIPRPRTPVIDFYLESISQVMYDTDWWLGEHCFQENGVAEHGFDMEQALWGGTLDSVMNNLGYSDTPRFLLALPLMANNRPWPILYEGVEKSLLGSTGPIEEQMMPLSLDMIARFFTKDFWETEFPTYGFQALRQFRPGTGDRVMKSSRPWVVMIEPRAWLRHFSTNEGRFIRCVTWGLRAGRYPLLAAYLESLILDVVRVQTFNIRWTDAIETWQDDLVAPLEVALIKFATLAKETRTLNNHKDADQVTREQHWLSYCQSSEGAANPLTFGEWDERVRQQWEECFRVGGTLMTQAAEVHRLMRLELSLLERLLFDFFNTELPLRGSLLDPEAGTDDTPIGLVHKRLLSFSCAAESCLNTISSINQLPQLAEIWHDWGIWRANFESNNNRYKYMLELLEDPDTITPNEDWWKATFKSVPSCFWKPLSDRLRVVAYRDYQNLDPRIRQTVDDVSEIIGRYKPNSVVPTPTQVNQLSGVLQNIAPNWDNQAKKVINKSTIFDFTMPQTKPPTGSGSGSGPANPFQAPPPGVQGVSQQPQQNSQGGNNITGSGIVLHVPGLDVTGLGGTPSRRTMANIPAPGAAATAASSFMQYGTAEANPIQAAMASISTTQNAKYPTPLPLKPNVTLFGTGQRFAEPTLPITGIPPFPNPYSNKTTLSQDVIAYAQNRQKQEMMEITSILFNGPNPYASQDPWREGNPGDSEDS